jgi:ribose transport system substrate-binding protein
MSQLSLRKAGLMLVAVLGLSLVLAACGSSDDSSSSSDTGSTEASTEAAGGDVAKEAAAFVAPYIHKPSPFPVTEKLKETPKGAQMAWVGTGTPFDALQWQLLGPALDVMGVDVQRFTAGLSANTVTTAFDSVIAKDPEAVMVGSIPIQLWLNPLEELQDKEIPVAAAGINEGEKYGLDPVQSSSEGYGELMANYVIGEMNPEANVAVYTIPEIPVVDLVAEEFVEVYEELCSACEVHSVDIASNTLGNSAPNTVVSDLQSHPDTDVAVFGSDEIQFGLPDALKTAGIEVETLGFAPQPTNLQYLKEGKEDAALAFDVAIGVWTQLDQATRELIGQPLTGPEAEGRGVYQFLTKEDITFNPEFGWSGYPDFAERFAKLWNAG